MTWKPDKVTNGWTCLVFLGVVLVILSFADSSAFLSDGISSDVSADTPVGKIPEETLVNDGDEGGVVEAVVHQDMKEGDSVDKRIRLFQYDPVEVGHVRYVQISPGRYVQLKTIAVKPPAFEIQNFLTPRECERLRELALDAGLHSSGTVPMTLAESGIDESEVIFDPDEWETKVAECDVDTDQKLDYTEVLRCIPGLEEGEVVLPTVLDHLYTNLTLDLDSDALIDAEELWLMHLENKTLEIKQWLSRWRAGELPPIPRRGRYRISEQTWLDWGYSQDPTVVELRDRFITILYYLHDVEEGGETAFPLAEFDNASKEFTDNLDYDHFDLAHNCHKNLNVKPEYGKAIMWYNHLIDEETGWLSSLNEHSLHGGCNVTKGIKWIANNWITVDDVYERQMAYQSRTLVRRKTEELLEYVESLSLEETNNENGDEKDQILGKKIGNETDNEEKDSSEKDQKKGDHGHGNNNSIFKEKNSKIAPSTDKSEGDLPKEHSEL